MRYRMMAGAGLVVLGSACAARTVDSSGVRISDIEPGYAATKVNTSIFRHHAILSQDGRQFVSFYDPAGRVTLASRRLPAGEWAVHHTEWKGRVQDAHNGISMGVSSDGLLHISYDHHGHPLRYRRSSKPLDPQSFGPLIPMTGERETRVTYPQFVNLADGTLLFLYRDGRSGRGDLCINRYHADGQRWSILQHPVISGAGRFNPYWCRPAAGTDGSLHLAWCWRSSGDASTNSRVCYAHSPDGGQTWLNSRGEPCTLPITPDTAEVIDPVEEGSNLSNQDSSEVDRHNRLHAVIRKNDPSGIPQFFHLWHDGRSWRQTQVSQFTQAFQMKGGGSLRTPLSRGDLFLDNRDTVFVLYRDNRQDSRPMAAYAFPPDYDRWTHLALAEVNLRQWEPNYDVGRWKKEGVLDLFIQSTDQGNHETVTETGPQMVRVLQWRP